LKEIMLPSEAVQCIAITGRFDIKHVHSTHHHIGTALEQTANLIIDLSGAHFIDSTALALLVRTMNQCRQAGGDLRLCGVQPSVRYIFELTRLDRAFTLFPNREAALLSFATVSE
jgi:anti-sigma B factor antagonist